MKASLTFFALIATFIFSSFANAATPASVSFACWSDRIVQVNLDGVNFSAGQLTNQGYSVSIVNGVLDLNHGTESLETGEVGPAGTCELGQDMRTALVAFDNLNLAISSNVAQLSACFAVTTDGVYGIHELGTLTFTALDNGFTMTLSSQFTEDYESLAACQAALK
jgi:hypothetical protein